MHDERSSQEACPVFDVTVASTPDELATDESFAGGLRRRRHPRGIAAKKTQPLQRYGGWTTRLSVDCMDGRYGRGNNLSFLYPSGNHR